MHLFQLNYFNTEIYLLFKIEIKQTNIIITSFQNINLELDSSIGFVTKLVSEYKLTVGVGSSNDCAQGGESNKRFHFEHCFFDKLSVSTTIFSLIQLNFGTPLFIQKLKTVLDSMFAKVKYVCMCVVIKFLVFPVLFFHCNKRSMMLTIIVYIFIGRNKQKAKK